MYKIYHLCLYYTTVNILLYFFHEGDIYSKLMCVRIWVLPVSHTLSGMSTYYGKVYTNHSRQYIMLEMGNTHDIHLPLIIVVNSAKC